METTGKIGTGTITAAVTAALAFLCTLLADYVGVAELGIIAAAGIILCALATFFVLPALISLADQNTDSARLPKPLEGNLPRRLLGRFPLATLGVSAAVVLVVGLQVVKFERFENHRILPRLRFDSNLLNLQAQDAESESVWNGGCSRNRPIRCCMPFPSPTANGRCASCTPGSSGSPAWGTSRASPCGFRPRHPGELTRQLLAQYLLDS